MLNFFFHIQLTSELSICVIQSVVQTGGWFGAPLSASRLGSSVTEFIQDVANEIVWWGT